MPADPEDFEWITMEYDTRGCTRCPDSEDRKKKNVKPRASDAALYKQKGVKAAHYRVKRYKLVPRLDPEGEEVRLKRVCTSCRSKARYNFSQDPMQLMIADNAAWKRIKARGPTAPRYYTIRDEGNMARYSLWVTQQDEDGTICNHGNYHSWNVSAWEGRVDSINNPNAVLLGEFGLAKAHEFHSAALSAEGKDPGGEETGGNEMKFSKSDSFQRTESFAPPPRYSTKSMDESDDDECY